MILTDAGVDAMTDIWESLLSWVRLLAGSDPVRQPARNSGGWPAPRDVNCITPSQRTWEADWESTMDSSMSDLSPLEQRARVVALRGLSEARSGDLVAAEATFTRAIDLDPALDLRRLPSFWKLPRQAHEAVIGALKSSGRSRDAAALIADLRTRYRPRGLPQPRDRQGAER